MFEVLPELIALGVATFGPIIGYVKGRSFLRKLEKKKRSTNFSGFTFGIALLQNDSRSPLEHFVINELHEQGAQCVLAGRDSIRAMVLDKDVIDGIGISNPQFVVVGTVEEREMFLTPSERPARTRAFFQWWGARFPLASVTVSGKPSESEDVLYRNLFGHYKLHHEDLYILYTKETGQSPYIDDGGRKYESRISIDCHSAQGTVVGSLFFNQEFYHRDREDLYKKIANLLVSRFHISHDVDVSSAVRYPDFAQGQIDGVLSRYGYQRNGAISANPTRQLSEDELPEFISRPEIDALINADQPTRTRVFKEG